MKIVLIQTGKSDKKYIREGISDFETRTRRLVPFETLTLPDLKNRKSLSPAEQMKMEATAVISRLQKGDTIVLLDERGKRMKSVEFASFLERSLAGSSKRVVFIIGGPYGSDKSLDDLCNLKLSLSDMTFSHQVVRLLFMEQLYRGLSIIKGLPYHNE